MTRGQVLLQEHGEIWGSGECPLDRHAGHWKNRGGGLGQMSAHFPLRGQRTHILGLGGHMSLLQLLSSGIVPWKQPSTIYEWKKVDPFQ